MLQLPLRKLRSLEVTFTPPAVIRMGIKSIAIDFKIVSQAQFSVIFWLKAVKILVDVKRDNRVNFTASVKLSRALQIEIIQVNLAGACMPTG